MVRMVYTFSLLLFFFPPSVEHADSTAQMTKATFKPITPDVKRPKTSFKGGRPALALVSRTMAMENIKARSPRTDHGDGKAAGLPIVWKMVFCFSSAAAGSL